jgi:hypothetical protein
MNKAETSLEFLAWFGVKHEQEFVKYVIEYAKFRAKLQEKLEGVLDID